MISWNSSLLLGVIIVFLIIFFWDFLLGKNICELKLHPKHIIEKKNIIESLKGSL
jgi:hypothetical protein